MRKYSAIPGNLRNTCDRFCGSYKAWVDDMIVGAIHWNMSKCGYDGWLSMDQYPYREDAVGAISESINWLKAFDKIMINNRDKIATTITEGDAVKTSALMRSILLG